MNVNLPKDNQVMQIVLVEELIGEYETHVEGRMKEPFLVGSTKYGDDHIKQYQIYSNKKGVYDYFEKKVLV